MLSIQNCLPSFAWIWIPKTLLFHTVVWWLSKIDKLALMYEIEHKFTLFFEANEKQDLFLLSNQEFHLTLANLVDIFEALNDLNLILQGKNFVK